MMKRVLATVLALSLLGGPAFGQDKTAPPTDPLKSAVEQEALKKQIIDLQQKLNAATADERVDAEKKAITAISQQVKDKYGKACDAAGGKWIWLRGNVGTEQQPTAFVGCVGK